MKNILLTAHHSGTPGGPLDQFYYYLKKKHKIFMVQHPLWVDRGFYSIIKYEDKEKKFKVFPYLQFFLEGLFTLHYLPRVKKYDKIDMVICFDPLSFFHFYLLRYFFRVKKIVYYNVDYSTVRFQNKIMNFIYKTVNIFAYKNSDYFFAITKKFIDDIDPHGRYAYKNFMVTHVVDTKKINLNVKKEENSLVYAGSIGYSVDFDPLFLALKMLKDNGINFNLDIYGGGKLNENVIKNITNLNLKENIFFKGVVDNKDLVYKVLPRYAIGICPYKTKDNPTAYDHMFRGMDLTSKLVEYIAVGLPIVTTKLNDYFDVIEKNKFGYLVRGSNEWYNALKKLLVNRALYKTYKNNALKFAKNYDQTKILEPIFKKILETKNV